MIAPTNSTPDQLLELPLGDVLRAMVRESGRNWEEIGAGMGWSPSVTNRIRCAEDNYWPSLPTLARFMVACRSTLLIEWLQAQVEAGAGRLDERAVQPEALPGLLLELFRELGDVAREGERACADGTIDAVEARRMIRETYDVINKCMRLVAGLRPLACAGE